jgi:oxygen-independent coproporphyrinogen-3 oxidase
MKNTPRVTAPLCPYCDFNIYKDKPELAADLTEAILKDLESWREASGPRSLASLHFGGGTPSLMQHRHMAAIIQKVQTLWTPQGNMEVALEANPGDISTESLASWKAVGIERLSIGVQSFDDEVLQFLGRNHDSETARRALELAVASMPFVSADMIYGWVGQASKHWQQELDTVLTFAPGHISAYQLTIEEKTAFAMAERRGQARAVDTDMSADLFELAGRVLGEAGYDRYEVSNFAKTRADQSRHNKLYWQGEDYVGVGPGAHGRLTVNTQRMATVSALKPRDYIDQGASYKSTLTAHENMESSARAEEYVLMGLRVSEGISLARFHTLAGFELSHEVMTPLVTDGLLIHKGDRLWASEQGRLVFHALLMQA